MSSRQINPTVPFVVTIAKWLLLQNQNAAHGPGLGKNYTGTETTPWTFSNLTFNCKEMHSSEQLFVHWKWRELTQDSVMDSNNNCCITIWNAWLWLDKRTSNTARYRWLSRTSESFSKIEMINAIFSKIYAKCKINVFVSFIFRKLHLKHKKNTKRKAQDCDLLEVFLQSDIHILLLLTCDVLLQKWY